MRNRTRDQFLNPQRTPEPGPGKAAEVDRAERTDVATQGRGVVGTVDAVAPNPPAAGIPRAKLTGHLDDHRSLRPIRPRRQRSPGIDQAHPDAVPQPETEPA